ncbi:MAG TPA: HNH endonuclease signature motif containing protein [Pseudaminobacter sp.]|nr:HNH endonuclease signature motif containing protein [Pseudaminobacter sp.]
MRIPHPKSPALTAERARELLSYDPNTGALTWKVGRPGVRVGALVGTRTSEGYTQIEIEYRLYRAHRVIWLIMTGAWPKHQVDHRNGMRADNRWRNLRDATPLQNARNRRPGASNTSGRIGVGYLKNQAKWSAYIGLDNRTIHLGSFDNVEDAIAARVEAERHHFGEFAPVMEASQ